MACTGECHPGPLGRRPRLLTTLCTLECREPCPVDGVQPCSQTCCPLDCLPDPLLCRYVQPTRRPSFKPVETYKPPIKKMVEKSVYRTEFGVIRERRAPIIRPITHLCIGEGLMSDETSHRITYAGLTVERPSPIIPKENKLTRGGRMQELTTNRYDFGHKQVPRVQPCYPRPHLHLSDSPLTEETTNRVDYLPLDVDKLKVRPIRYKDNIEKPKGRMAELTMHRIAYPPLAYQKRDETPWKFIGAYAPPCDTMHDYTTHQVSYPPPGYYVECKDGGDDCVPCPNQRCVVEKCGNPCCPLAYWDAK